MPIKNYQNYCPSLFKAIDNAKLYKEKLVLIDIDGSYAMNTLASKFDSEFNINGYNLEQISNGISDGNYQYNDLVIGQHGNSSAIKIGDTDLTLENIDDYVAELQQIGNSVDGTIYLIECNAGQNELLLQKFSEYTGQPVVASKTMINADTGKNTPMADILYSFGRDILGQTDHSQAREAIKWWGNDWVIATPNGSIIHKSDIDIPFDE